MGALTAPLAAHRFGLGARPGELGRYGASPRAALLADIDRPAPLHPIFEALPSTAEVLALRPKKKAEDLPEKDQVKFVVVGAALHQAESAARLIQAITTPTPFHERLVHHWSNHFTVSVTNRRVMGLAGPFEREAIRPGVTGSFGDLLLASTRHPAMLVYLDNALSFGPSSTVGKRRKLGLNENLAREILELHTLGVDGGYAQADVIGLAKIITGWTVPPGEDGFSFVRFAHEPGEKTLLGKRYGEGESAGVQALADLAAHPATARYVSARFARAFVPAPPQASIDRLTERFRSTGGDLRALARAAVEDDALWTEDRRHLRTPWEFMVAVLRGLGDGAVRPLAAYVEAAGKLVTNGGDLKALRGVAGDAKHGRALMESLKVMGQTPFSAPSPKGWPDDDAAWTGPDAILERLEWSYSFAHNVPIRFSPLELGQGLLGGALSQSTRLAIEQAASPAQGLALLFSSPEFQRR